MPANRVKGTAVRKTKRLISNAAIEKAAAIAEAERLEKLPPHERLAEVAKQRQDISDSLMRVNFPSLRGIKNVKGLILVIADDSAALKQALKEAEAALGPTASPDAVMNYAEAHRVKTCLMSVKVFKRNLMTTLRLCNGHAEMFGAGSGGGAIKDVFEEGTAAIKEAEKYWEDHNNQISKELRDFLTVGTSTDKDTFDLVLGKDWKNDDTLDPETKKLLGLI
jgi:hypothetical protein